MKATTMGFVRWIGVAGLIFAISGVESHYAMAQQLVSFGHTDQQPSPAASNLPQLPVITPEVEADMLAAHQQYQDAIAAYKKLTPQTAEIYNKIGMAYQHLSMDQEATINYQRALKLDHKLAAAYNNLGTVYYHEKNNKQAERLYRKSIKLDAKTAPVWSNLGAVYLARKDYSDGAEAYERAYTLDSNILDDIALNGIREFASHEDLARMYLWFAEIYAQAGMKDQAIDYLRKALLEGFYDKQIVQQDQQLASLRGTPEFEQLLSNDHKR